MNLNGFLSMTGNISGNLGSDLVVEVEANPSGVATEPLIKLRVGNVIYAIPSGGGGGGTSDYNLLTNKPKINGIILQDELSLHSLGIQEEITFSGEATEYLNGEGIFSTPPFYVPINYDTTEQNTGIKWIDGNDIYMKVVNFGSDLTILKTGYNIDVFIPSDTEYPIYCALLNESYRGFNSTQIQYESGHWILYPFANTLANRMIIQYTKSV